MPFDKVNEVHLNGNTRVPAFYLTISRRKMRGMTSSAFSDVNLKKREEKSMKQRLLIITLLVSVALCTVPSLVQAQVLKPFVLGTEPQQADLGQVVTSTKTALQGQGFEVVGSYSPYPNAVVIVVTNDVLKANAAKSDFGGYGAAQRVGVTKVKDKVQVSYTNPPYMAAVYRMNNNLDDVKAKLEAALGKQKEYGSEKGLEAKKLRKYNYMFGMAKFDSLGDHKLAEFKSYQRL